MLRFTLFFLITVLCVPPAAAQKKAVFIILDGIPADVLENTPTPVLDEIAGTGKTGYTRGYIGGEKDGYSQSPTISAVGYNHVLTGTWTNKHNVWDNDIKAPNYNYWNIFRIVKTVKPGAATAIFSTWLDNRTKLIGEGLAEAGNIKLDYSFDGFELDTRQFPHDKERIFIFNIDEKVSTEAGRYILEQGPDLSWVYLEYTDDMGHTFGDSPQLTDAVKKADVQVGRVWDAIKKRTQQYGEEWMIVITTDHGRDAKTGKDHGGQGERERTVWFVTNVTTNSRFKQTPATVDVMPSILRHLDITAPEKVMSEVDGVPFVGPVSISDVKALRKGNTIEVSWKAHDPDGKVKIELSSTNRFKEGGIDQYKTAGEAPVSSEKYVIQLPANESSAFFKVLVKAPHNTLSYWITK
ncbi:MAG: alkaline phosphatase family protein [Cyclobacteriaceae bacterium]|nr:alkaline phosphatase family protein [Cyclobacteriaceae bacterium]